MFQNAGEKGDRHLDASDPPRRRGNKRKGHETYENDRPPIVGTKGRESGLLRLRLVHHTDAAMLSAHVHRFTLPTATVYTDGWRGYRCINYSAVGARLPRPLNCVLLIILRGQCLSENIS